ncbi:MAG TPA: glycosyltransferase 87 family protein [Pyrinomonadaceae bacterium]|nr:glycosyltransferase 87 family protein [Pyrinomonadaceae bacterium]
MHAELSLVNTKSTVIALSVLGVAMLFLFRIAAPSKGVADIAWFLKLVVIQSVIYLAVAWLSLRSRDSRSILLIGLVFAALFRLSIIFFPPYLSDDIYRYIWDGRVQAAGINPYRYIPAEEPLAQLRDDKIYPHINRRETVRTIYPPVGQAMFLVVTRFSESVTWMKAAMVGFEAIAIWAIIQLLSSLGFARQRALIYAWHPLAVWEFAGSGHADALAIAFIALALLARRKNTETLTGVLLACATCVKLFPVVLFPALYTRKSWKMPLAFVATILIAYLPYLSVGPMRVLGSLPAYSSEQGLVSGRQYFLLTLVRQLLNAEVPTVAYFIFVAAVLGILSLWMMRDRAGDDTRYLRNGLLIASLFMLFQAPHFSWYFTWLIPFLCFIPSIPFFYLTLANFVLYLTWLNDTPNRVVIYKVIIFAPFLVLGLIAIWLRLRSAKNTPKAFANFSPGFERSENPGSPSNKGVQP